MYRSGVLWGIIALGHNCMIMAVITRGEAECQLLLYIRMQLWPKIALLTMLLITTTWSQFKSTFMVVEFWLSENKKKAKSSGAKILDFKL